MNKKTTSIIKKTVKENEFLMVKLLVEQWNSENPHFGGGMPHRYDGKSRHCSYCNRPKDWKPLNPSFIAQEISADDDLPKTTRKSKKVAV